jgi:16S rRNA (guanine966-N2)-methyltransferase
VTRIIAGAARGRRLCVPDGRTTRPTSDRAREGLFSALESLVGGLDGLRVLDLYAGSGAVGLEALSRGARAVLLVEAERSAVRVARENLDALGLPGGRIVQERAERFGSGPCREAPYDVLFLDPPYAVGNAELAAVLTALEGGGWIAADAVVAVERASRGEDWVWPAGFDGVRSRAYGEARVWYGRRRADAAE